MSNNNNNHNNNPRGGGGGGGGGMMRRMDSGGDRSSQNNRGGGSSSHNNHRQNQNNSRGPRRRIDISQFPVEQGIICSLKESFGFIHCAERPEEVFFHYSEVIRGHPDDLQVDMEVEFRVGASEKDSSKLAAYEVAAVPTGTVIWETEEEPEHFFEGLVERNIPNQNSRGGNNNNRSSISDTEGSIRVVVADPGKEQQLSSETKIIKPSGPLVRFRADDYQPEQHPNKKNNERGGGSNRLFRGDLVQFRILTDRRTKQKYARYITLLQTEKERKSIEREKKLMATAVEEEGIIISLNKGFGFLKSNKRREHVYFHYSHLIIPTDVEDFELKKGQECKFLVVLEATTPSASEGGGGGGGGGGDKPKSAARKLECLPAGSVVFHTVVAKGVKGVVTLCPRPPSVGNSGYSDDRDGTIRLEEAILAAEEKGEDDGGNNAVQDVSLQFSDAPGGVYTYETTRGRSVNGLWILEGDTLLFDVIKELADGSYRASPSLHTLGVDGVVQEPPSSSSEQDEEEGAAATATSSIRFVSTSLVGRAEGVLHTLKGGAGYGFIHFAERPIDVHFNTYNILPEEIQADLRKQMGFDEKPIKLDVGVGVQFDICAHGTVASSNNSRGGGGGGGARHGRGQQERENVKGQRILLLPSSSIVVDKVVATGAKGVVKSADSKQLYAGFLDFEEDLQPMSLDERHPLVAKMIDAFLEESSRPTGRKSLVFRDVLSMKDDEVVIEMVKARGNSLLSCKHIPVAGMGPGPGRLCIRKVEEEEEQKIEEEQSKPTGTPGKKKQFKPNMNLRFDKASLSEELKDEIPPAAGDVITCNVVQSRRTGKFIIHNLKIVKRSEIINTGDELASSETSGLGVVKDVVPKSNFGFISVLDENATRRELLFFHLSSDGKQSRKINFRKGDEVKFDIGKEKGKRVAKNVQVVAKGTIPSMEAKNACRGFVLMEPTHTSLSDTPLRKGHSNISTGSNVSSISTGSDKSGGGRWGGNVKEDPQKAQNHDVHGEGCILLLEDKSGMFTAMRRNRKKDKSDDGSKDDDDAKSMDSIDDAKSVDSMDDAKSVDDIEGLDKVEAISILRRLPYKNGGIAIHGTGSSNSLDASAQPRRGDLVSFVKARSGKGVRDIRVITSQAATLLRGRLEDIESTDTGDSEVKAGKAKFIAATEKQEEYEVNLAEVVSCDPAILKDKQAVEGILVEGKIYGICRTADLYLTSKMGTSHKERPKLNLSVKKGLGGKIMAQSMMAKGPDGTIGFAAGWTTRTSQYGNLDTEPSS